MSKAIQVLYIDDNPFDRELVRDVLEKEHGGFRLTEASSRQEFNDRLEEADYDLILSDFNILGFEGFDVVDDVRARGLDTPVVIVTGTGSEEIAVGAMKRDVADYVIKTPNHIKRLPHTILKILEKRRLTQERRQAEEALRKSEEKHRTLFETMIQGVVYQNASGEIISANPAAQRILGLTLDQMMGRTSVDPRWKTIHEDGTDYPGEEHPSMVALRTGNEVKNAVMGVFNPKLERHTWINVNAIPVFKSGEEGAQQVYTTFEDITERKRLEDEKTAIEAQLRQSQKLEAVGTFASGVAHEINNPLQGIMGYAELIKELVGDHAEVNELSGQIQDESKRIATIVKNLLSFARQDKQSKSPARIQDIIAFSLTLLSPQLRTHQIKVETSVPDELPLLNCRSQQIQQVLINLVTNARDALNQKYQNWHENKIIRISAEQLAKDQEEWLRITVEDQGGGMSREICERIFDPFFTTKERGKGSDSAAAPPGTGLGLSVSYGIVKDHQGELWVESKPGEYARFYVDLPLAGK